MPTFDLGGLSNIFPSFSAADDAIQHSSSSDSNQESDSEIHHPPCGPQIQQAPCDPENTKWKWIRYYQERNRRRGEREKAKRKSGRKGPGEDLKARGKPRVDPSPDLNPKLRNLPNVSEVHVQSEKAAEVAVCQENLEEDLKTRANPKVDPDLNPKPRKLPIGSAVLLQSVGEAEIGIRSASKRRRK